MPDTTLPYKGSMFISFGRLGWSETFFLGTLAESDAIARLNDLAMLRAYLLPPAAKIAYARCTVQGEQGKSIVSLEAPISGLNQTLTTKPAPQINDVNVGLMFRVQGAGAVHATRHIHAIPDEFIEDGEFTEATPVGGWAPVNTFTQGDPPEGADWLHCLTNYLSALRVLTTINRKVTTTDGDGNPVVTYSPTVINGFILRGVRTRKVGRPFDTVPGRVIRR